jgi:D-alanyl-D-alanine carboxypeptidase/D-alanyl-D-alanine-endopeptidase (penicillin-binding protein 4)
MSLQIAKTMRTILIFSLIFISSTLLAQRNTAILNEAWIKFDGSGANSAAHSGICIRELSSGTTVFAKNEAQNFVPASSLKLVTGLLALETFPADHRFITMLGRRGEVDVNGKLLGDIVIDCQGDPAFLSDRSTHYQNQLQIWAQKIKSQGISAIEGKIIVDESYFEGFALAGGVLLEDAGNYYGSGSTACCMNENRQVLSFRSHEPGTDVELLGQYPELGINYILMLKASSNQKDEAYVIGSPGSYERTIIGSIPAHKDSFFIEASLPEPGMALCLQMKLALTDAGVNTDYVTFETNSNPALKSAYTLLDLKSSPPLSELVLLMEKHSINLYADILLRHCAKQKGLKTSLDESGKLLTQRIKNSYLSLEDGSGLSRKNAISPKDMCELVSTFHVNLRNQLIPMLKQDINEERSIYYKTGYMEDVRARAGFIKRNGVWYSFSLMVNGYTDDSVELRKGMDSLMDALVKGL